MHREQAFEAPGLWAGTVRSDPGVVSGWHHHGDYDTCIYVVDGCMRVEFGAEGTCSVEAGAGDFVHVPKRTVHRESACGDVPVRAVLVRAGRGAPTVNVEAPQ